MLMNKLKSKPRPENVYCGTNDVCEKHPNHQTFRIAEEQSVLKDNLKKSAKFNILNKAFPSKLHHQESAQLI